MPREFGQSAWLFGRKVLLMRLLVFHIETEEKSFLLLMEDAQRLPRDSKYDAFTSKFTLLRSTDNSSFPLGITMTILSWIRGSSDLT